jgi:PqqA peptide cyclase
MLSAALGHASQTHQSPAAQQAGPPFWLLAELTYRCPLHCVFCYNPVDISNQAQELSTDEWLKVLRDARALGAVQLGFSGGEPLVRDDLEVLVAEGHRLGFYTNLITSGVGLTQTRIAALKQAGLDHIQLSFQDSTREMNDFLSHTKTFAYKEQVARLIKQHGYPMVLNVVLHRFNIDHVEKIIDMAVDMDVEYLELANTQYYGWGEVNREQLMPSREQLRRAEAATNQARARLAAAGNKIRILFVVPDYYEERPKACMNGWGSVFLTITPDGTALPCHAARMLPGKAFPNVRAMSITDIWHRSEGFNRYRGDQWMQEPCRTCPERSKDFGGCRCQAFMLTGDAAAADPVCSKSPQRSVVDAIVAKAQSTPVSDAAPGVRPLVFRTYKQSEKSA